MSRIGNVPIKLPKTITLQQGNNIVMVKGAKGELSIKIPAGITVSHKDDTLSVISAGGKNNNKALHGVIRTQLSNAVAGVTDGWTKRLELVGVGYRAVLNGANLQLSVGFSHTVTVIPEPGITFQIAEGKVVITGIDKQLVGETAARIREIRKPEPYKGKGIRYVGEHVRKKAGKAAKAIGGAVGGK